MAVIKKLLLSVVLLVPIACLAANLPPKKINIAIIIDDLGNNLSLGKQAIELPGALGMAILPLSPQTVALANYAYEMNKEVIAHIPMDNKGNKALGPGGLRIEMSAAQLSVSLLKSIRSVPHIQGISNHMGSILTEELEQMTWVMEILRELPMYFIDSRTSSNTVAYALAKKYNIPSLERHVFLDNDPSYAAIDHQFNKLLDIARRNGSAVAIGHPYPSTLAYLEYALPKLSSQGIKLIAPSELIALDSTYKQKPHTYPDAILITQCHLVELTHMIQVKC